MNDSCGATDYWYRRETATDLLGVGESTTNIENGTRVSPNVKMVTAWNEMVKFNLDLHEYLYANRDDFPDYIGINYTPYANYSSMFYLSKQLQDYYELFTPVNAMF